MSDTTNNPAPAETPVNQGGGSEPQPASDSNTDSEELTAETPVNQGGGSAG
jgi:hypothetical protein